MEFYNHNASSAQIQRSTKASSRARASTRHKREPQKRNQKDGIHEDSGSPTMQERSRHPNYVEAPETLFTSSVIREREKKWLAMLNDWDRWMSKSRSKIKERCRKGIPPSLRAKAWQYLSGAVYMQQKNPNTFQNLDRMPSPEWEKIIWKDIPRTFPYHQLFADDGSGQKELFRVLSAYSLYDPVIGYSQAMAPVAAVLLMHMPAEEAFWVLVSICKKYMMGYYGPKLEAVQLDSAAFSKILRDHLPSISRHLEKYKVDPLLYIVEWLMCLFCRSLPFSTVLRLWDMFFCEGIKVLLRTSLALVKLVFPRLEDINNLSDEYEIVQKLVALPIEVLHEEVLVPESLSVKLKEKDLEKYHSMVLVERPDLVFT